MFCYLLACLVDGVGERLENVASLGVVAALHKHEYVVEEERDETRAAVHVPLEFALVDELALPYVQALVGHEEGRAGRVRVELARVHARLDLGAALLVLALGDRLVDVERDVAAGGRAARQSNALDAALGRGTAAAAAAVQALGQLVEEQAVLDQPLHLGRYEVLEMQLAAHLVVLRSLSSNNNKHIYEYIYSCRIEKLQHLATKMANYVEEQIELVVLELVLQELHGFGLILTEDSARRLELVAELAVELLEQYVDERLNGHHHAVPLAQLFEFVVEGRYNSKKKQIFLFFFQKLFYYYKTRECRDIRPDFRIF